LLGLTRAAALELIDAGVRVNALCPGLVETPIITSFVEGSDDPNALEPIKASIPLGRIGTPDEIAAAALWLGSDQSSFMYGQSLIVDGGELI
jgi:NAD(P)-dependent dehydrogenase (short-subunit alcohol dehydrogenase family)